MSTDISTKVMGIYRFIAAAAGIGNIFFLDWQMRQLSNLPDAVERYMPGPTKIIGQSWGIIILQFAFLAHRGLSFSSGERRVVCRCFSLTFGILTLLFWGESFAPSITSTEKETRVFLGFGAFFACLLFAYTWASLENVPSEENTTTSRTTTPAQGFLSKVGYYQAIMSISAGLMSVLLPSGFYAFDSSAEAQPNPSEAFAIRCWGGYILGIGALCTQLKTFALGSQLVVGLSCILQFMGLTCLYFCQWEELNFSYRIGSIPIFLPTAILWIVAVGRVVTEASALPSLWQKRK